MEHITHAEVPFTKKTASLRIREYVTTHTIDVAVAVINGRYPEAGDGVNEVSEMVMMVLSGSGVIAVNGLARHVTSRDVVIVQPGEPYHYEGCHSLEVSLTSTPPFSVDQYKMIDAERHD